MEIKGKHINIDKALTSFQEGNGKNRIHLVGIELEGGWVKLPDGVSPIRDGSISGLRAPGSASPEPTAPPPGRQRGESIDAYMRRHEQAAREALRQSAELWGTSSSLPKLKIGEIPSHPMEVEKFTAWMKKFYPVSVNETCGLHVHMSFQSALHYQRLMVPEYPATIVAYVRAWAKDQALPPDHPLWPRLDGKSVYCQHEFSADLQSQHREKGYNQTANGHRYTVINYCWTTHSTLECRLLPMMASPELGISAVQNVLNITNAFLLTTLGKEKRLEAKAVIPSGEETFSKTRNEVI